MDLLNQNKLPTADVYSSCSLNKQDHSYFGHIDGTLTACDGMPVKPTAIDILIHREKPEYKARKHQIAINLLGLGGGRPYVNNRLSRYAGESIVDWIGGKRGDGSCSTGRLQQTHSFPYLGRIASKINQYVFSEYPARDGADELVLKDITRDGMPTNDFMRAVSSNIFAAEGCWVGIDMPSSKQDGSGYTLADVDALKLRPYWQLYTQLDVPDYKYDEVGHLLWVKTRGVEYDDSDPTALPQHVKVTKLWERGKVTIIRVKKSKDKRKKDEITTEERALDINVVPFVQCGSLSGKPIAFDDLESINRTIMDLGSVNRANIFKGVYPQLVIPAGVMNSVMNSFNITAPEATKLLLGFNYPIQVPDDATVSPFYLTPTASDLSIVGTEIATLKRDLFEVVGLALETNSRQVASAEAKAWDFLDVAAVMKARAEQLEDIERKCVAMSELWDGSFEGWEPAYNTNFDIGDFEQEMKSLVMIANVPQPEEMTRYVLEKIVDRTERVLSKSDPEKVKVVMDAIANFSGATVDVDFGDEKVLLDPTA